MLALEYEFNRRFPNVRRLDTFDGPLAQLLTLGKPGDVVRWVADAKGAVRAAVTDEKSLASRVFWRADRGFALGAARRVQARRAAHLSAGVRRRRFRWSSLSNIGRDTYAIYRYDTTKKALGEALATSARSDLTGTLQYDWAKNRIVGLAFNAALPGAVWFDDDWARLQQTIDASLPNHRNVLSGDARRALIYSYSDVDPGSYYFYDGEKRRLEFLVARRKGTRAVMRCPRASP